MLKGSRAVGTTGPGGGTIVVVPREVGNKIALAGKHLMNSPRGKFARANESMWSE